MEVVWAYFQTESHNQSFDSACHACPQTGTGKQKVKSGS